MANIRHEERENALSDSVHLVSLYSAVAKICCRKGIRAREAHGETPPIAIPQPTAVCVSVTF